MISLWKLVNTYLLTFLCYYGVRYYKNQNLKTAFEVAPADPTVDLNMQL